MWLNLKCEAPFYFISYHSAVLQLLQLPPNIRYLWVIEKWEKALFSPGISSPGSPILAVCGTFKVMWTLIQTFSLFMLKAIWSAAGQWTFFPVWLTAESLTSQLSCYTTVSAQSNSPLDTLMLKNAEGLRILYHRISSLWDERLPRKTGFSMVCNGKNLASISYKSINGDSTI